MNLSPNERTELARLLDGGSLDALLRGWRAFVTQVERGYDDSIYEYTNDLSVRDRLERLLAGAGPSLRAALAEAVAGDDARFEAATEPAVRPLRETAPPPWWCRVPRRRVGELAQDLSALGHLG
jgi:hypothetical protein